MSRLLIVIRSRRPSLELIEGRRTLVTRLISILTLILLLPVAIIGKERWSILIHVVVVLLLMLRWWSIWPRWARIRSSSVVRWLMSHGSRTARIAQRWRRRHWDVRPWPWIGIAVSTCPGWSLRPALLLLLRLMGLPCITTSVILIRRLTPVHIISAVRILRALPRHDGDTDLAALPLPCSVLDDVVGKKRTCERCRTGLNKTCTACLSADCKYRKPAALGICISRHHVVVIKSSTWFQSQLLQAVRSSGRLVMAGLACTPRAAGLLIMPILLHAQSPAGRISRRQVIPRPAIRQRPVRRLPREYCASIMLLRLPLAQ